MLCREEPCVPGSTSERGGRLRSVWFSDEAHFYLSGTVNSQNYIHWASDEVIERNLQVTKATAWVA